MAWDKSLQPRRISVPKGRRLRLGCPEGLSAVFTGGIGPGPEGSRLTPDVRRFRGCGEDGAGGGSPKPEEPTGGAPTILFMILLSEFSLTTIL